MNLKKVFRQIKFQTLVGWAAGYLAGVVFNVILKGKFDTRFWLSLGAVLIVRVAVDVAFAVRDARKNQLKTQ